MACVDAPKIDGQQVEEGRSLLRLYKICSYMCNNQGSMRTGELSLPLACLDTIKILISIAQFRCLLLFSTANLGEAEMKTNGQMAKMQEVLQGMRSS